MHYFSTRGSKERLTFEQTVLTGLASDGGLYIPSHIPTLPENWKEEWKDLPFTDLALNIYSLFIDSAELSREELKGLIEKSYSTFRHPDIAPLKQVGDKEWILELFHGPTFAFKDVALQFLGNLFEFFLMRKNGDKPDEERETLTVVGATSGDTGGAAIYGLRSKRDISIFILHPKGRISPIQEAQMTSVTDENVFNLAVEGTFDDCQDIVKALFSDTTFNGAFHLGAINSINWARILAQTVYYFSSYFAMLKVLPPSTHSTVSLQYCVPTGNFGDILAGYYAKRLGLPMDKLVVATNSNDILPRFWATGRYEKADSSIPAPSTTESAQTVIANGSSDGAQATSNGGVAETLSPAMDILVSSNFERLLFYLALEGTTDEAVATEGEKGGLETAKVRMASAHVKDWMNQLKTVGKVVVPERAVDIARRDLIAQMTTDPDTTTTIQKYFNSTLSYGSYVLDPHTAVGINVANRIQPNNSENIVQVILATAHPAKFNAAVADALVSIPTFDFERDIMPVEFHGLLDLPRKMFDVAGNAEAVKVVVEREVTRMRGLLKKDKNGASI